MAGRSVFKIPPLIYNFEILPDDSLFIPRGYRTSLYSIMKDFDVTAEITDNRKRFDPICNMNSSMIRYRPYQYRAIIDLVKSEEGVLVAPAGSGKTVMGLSLIPLFGQPTLWLTHTGPLADQAISRIKSFLPSLSEDDIGYIGGSKWKLGNVITVAMVQTLARRMDTLYKIRDNFGLVVLDECLVSGTQIETLDGSVKDITNIKNGDVTTFGEVSNKFSRTVDSVILLRGGWGKIKGTETHMLPYVPRDSLTLNKHTGTLNPVAEKHVILDKMSNINRKDFLLIKESNCHTEKYVIGKRKSRLLSLIACDGHIQKNLYCIQVGIVKDKDWFLKEMEYDTSFAKNPDIRISNCTRGDLIIRAYSKELVVFLNKFIPAGKKQTLTVPYIMEYSSIEDIRNYLQVAFDTEGGLNENQITITMSTPEYLIGIQHLLKKFGIVSRVIPIKDRVERKGYSRLALSGYDAFLFYKKIGFSMKRKQDELLSIIKHAHKFVRRVTYKGAKYRCMPILSKTIEKDGPYEVFDFTTKEHFFIANSVLSSNCHHTPASTFFKVIGCFNPYYLYGLTATPYRRDKLENLMFQTLGDTVATITAEELDKSNSIVIPKVKYRSFYHNKPIHENQHSKLLKDYIVFNDKRNHMIVGDVLIEAAAGNYCIVLSDRKAHCEILHKLISIGWNKTGMATGNLTKNENSEQIAKLIKGEITVLVCTNQLLGEGFDFAPLNRAFIACPFRFEGKCEQVIGRIQRTAPGKTDAIVYDYVDADIGVLLNQFYGKGSCRHKAYERLGALIEPC